MKTIAFEGVNLFAIIADFVGRRCPPDDCCFVIAWM